MSSHVISKYDSRTVTPCSISHRKCLVKLRRNYKIDKLSCFFFFFFKAGSILFSFRLAFKQFSKYQQYYKWKFNAYPNTQIHKIIVWVTFRRRGQSLRKIRKFSLSFYDNIKQKLKITTHTYCLSATRASIFFRQPVSPGHSHMHAAVCCYFETYSQLASQPPKPNRHYKRQTGIIYKSFRVIIWIMTRVKCACMHR